VKGYSVNLDETEAYYMRADWIEEGKILAGKALAGTINIIPPSQMF
jgi:hypothetical protein